MSSATEKLEAFKEEKREGVITLLEKTLPEKVLELNELLASDKLSIQRVDSIHVSTLNSRVLNPRNVEQHSLLFVGGAAHEYSKAIQIKASSVMQAGYSNCCFLHFTSVCRVLTVIPVDCSLCRPRWKWNRLSWRREERATVRVGPRAVQQ